MGHKLLVVDDNRDAAESLAILLRLHGHAVAVAHDGPTAVQLAIAERPEMIFLDLGMPGMSGYEVARQLRGLPDFRRTILAALTGWGQEEIRNRCHDTGFDLHLMKPLDPELLRELLSLPLLLEPSLVPLAVGA
jgi:CheY-like chemotaxis protein